MSSTTERKLAAIVFTDLVDFSLLSGKDENKALQVIQKQNEIVTPLLKKFKGTLHKETGDGLVLTFKTVTDAVKFSINLQRAIKDLPDLNLRIGIHEGEITFQDNDILGDDVNITSRIEPFAAKGGIAISGKIQQNLLSLPEFETKYIGKPKLKGISQTIEVYCITSQGLPETNISEVSAKLEKEKSNYNIFTLTGGLLTVIGLIFWISISFFDILQSNENKEIVPSIGILLMENKGSKESSMWSEMLTEELTYKLSQAGMIRITPIYKIINMDSSNTINELARTLNIQYILSSSLYKDEKNFNLFYNLIDIKSGEIKYNNKWTESIDNASAIVSDISKKILTSININVNKNLEKSSTDNSLAYEYYIRSEYVFKTKIEHKDDDEIEIKDLLEYKGLLEKAIDLDSNFVLAKINLPEVNGHLYILEHGEEKFIENKKLIFELVNEMKRNIKQAKYLNKKREEGMAINALALIYKNLESIFPEKIDSIIPMYNKALKLFKDINDKESESLVLNNIAVMYEKDGKMELSFDYCMESLKILSKISSLDDYDLDNEILNIYHLESLGGDYDKLIEYYLLGLNFYNNLGYENIYTKKGFSGFVIQSLFLSRTYSHRGEYQQAILHYKDMHNHFLERYKLRVLQKDDENNTKNGVLVTKLWIGNEYLNMGKIRLAIEEFESVKSFYYQKEEGYDLSRFFGGTPAKVEFMLGISYYRMGEYEISKKYFDDALSNMNDDEDDDVKALILSWHSLLENTDNKNEIHDRAHQILNFLDKIPSYDIDNNSDFYIDPGLVIIGDIQTVYFNLYKIFININETDTAYKYLKISYDLLMKKSETYSFSEAKYSFLNNSLNNKEIIEEYNKVFKIH